MRPPVPLSLKAILLLIVLAVLALSQPALVRADDPPPVLPLSQAISKPPVQWKTTSPPMGTSAMTLPDKIPAAWASSSAAAPLPKLGITGAPGAAALWTQQPLLQAQPALRAQFDWPKTQDFARTLPSFPAGTSLSPARSPADTFAQQAAIRSLSVAASADTRWQLDDKLMTRDAVRYVQLLLASTSYGGSLFSATTTAGIKALSTLEYVTYVNRWEPLATVSSVAHGAIDVALREWSGPLTTVATTVLDNTVLKSPSAQALTGPFVSTKGFEQTIRSANYEAYTRASVQVTMQPIYERSPTSWFSMPVDFTETRITQYSSRETFRTTPTWSGFSPSYVTPAWQSSYTMPTFRSTYTPPIQTFNTYSFPQVRGPSLNVVVPSIQWPR